MATATAFGPLASLTMPQEKNSRLAIQVVLVVAGSILMAISSKISVPFWPVPMTMQTLALFLISAAYGRNLAVATMLLYLAEGAIGLPVFAKGGGLAYLAGPTAGYLVSYPLAAAIVGWAADRGFDRNPFKLAGAMLVAEIVILGMGAAWLAWVLGVDKAIAGGVGPFIVVDLVKIALASALVPAVWALLGKRA
jgi:biotin transport system substrate-specific component